MIDSELLKAHQSCIQGSSTSVSARRKAMAYTLFLAPSLQSMQHTLGEVFRIKAAGQQQSADIRL
jgi:hypothetical protein